MEAVLSLLLAAVLILGAALWWQTGARFVTEPYRRGDISMARFLQRAHAWEWRKRRRTPDRLTQLQMDYAVADAETRFALRFATFRWAGGLAMLAGAGWLIGNAVATESHRSPRETLAFVALGVVGFGVALSSRWMWRLYPWWHDHNPVERAITGGLLRGKRRLQVADARRQAGASSRRTGARMLEEETSRADAEFADGLNAAWWLGRVGFAGVFVAGGLLVVVIALAELFG